MILAPLSEMFGRRIVLQSSNIFFIIFSLACGFAQTANQLTAFRFFCGLGGSAPLVCGGGVIADLFTPDNRGTAMSMYSLAPLLGPCIGPLVGGCEWSLLSVIFVYTWSCSRPFDDLQGSYKASPHQTAGAGSSGP